jgi:hypothetical protein
MPRSLFGVLVLSAVPMLACGKGDSATSTEPEKADASSSDMTKLRDDYRRQKQTDIAGLDQTIAEIEKKERSSSAAMKRDLESEVVTIKKEREAFVRDLAAADGKVGASWDSTKAGLDKEWGDLTGSIDKAAREAKAAVSGHKAGEMTCEDFLALGDVERPKAAYWIEGYNRSGKLTDSFIDVDETDKMVPVLVSDCTKNPTEPLSKVVKRHTEPVAKATATAPRPEKMSCQDFTVLSEVVKPKVVYWALGFNKDGGPTDAVFDVEATDQVVPKLVKECTETPKLTFWEKVKRFL